MDDSSKLAQQSTNIPQDSQKSPQVESQNKTSGDSKKNSKLVLIASVILGIILLIVGGIYILNTPTIPKQQIPAHTSVDKLKLGVSDAVPELSSLILIAEDQK